MGIWKTYNFIFINHDSKQFGILDSGYFGDVSGIFYVTIDANPCLRESTLRYYEVFVNSFVF